MRGLLNVQYALVSRRPVRPGGQPACVAHGAVRLQGHGRLPGQGCGPRHGRATPSRTCARAASCPRRATAASLDLDAPIAVKEAVLPFKRFRTTDGIVVDTVLGPEMRSTGEVMGFDVRLPDARSPSPRRRRSAACRPSGSVVRLGRGPRQALDRLPDQAPRGARASRSSRPRAPRASCAATASRPRVVRKYSSGRGADGEPTIVDLITEGKVDMVVNTPVRPGRARRRLRDPRCHDRRGQADRHDRPAARAAVQGIEAVLAGPFDVWPACRSTTAAHGRASRRRRTRDGAAVTPARRALRGAARRGHGRPRAAVRGHRPAPGPARGVGPARRRHGAARVRACGSWRPWAGTVAALKPQSALFERHGSAGVAVLEEVLAAAAATGPARDAERSSTPSAATSGRPWPATPTPTCATARRSRATR